MEKSRREFIEERFTVPWGHIAAKVYGRSSTHRVLMVHGILDNAGSFDRLLTFLPKGYQYVCIDLPGHGFSSPYPPGVPLHYFNYVHCIQAVLDALKWESCIYIGHSFGAHLSVFFTVLYPDRIQKLICLDSIGPAPFDTEDLLRTIREEYSLKSTRKNRTYTKAEILHALQFRRSTSLNLEAAEALFTRAVRKVGDLYEYNRDPRLKLSVRPLFSLEQTVSIIRKLSVPTLLIVASESWNSELIHSLALKIRLHSKTKLKLQDVSVQGNHDVHNNHPERVAPHICAFLESNVDSKL